MNYRIKINYPEERMKANRARMDARERFEYTDRVPVVFNLGPDRFPLHARGVGWLEYFSDPEVQLYHQLENEKWVIENIPDNHVTSPEVIVGPVFGNISTVCGFGVNIGWSDLAPPRVVPPWLIKNPGDVDKLKVPRITDYLWGKRINWFHHMEKLVDKFEVIFNEERIKPKLNSICGAEGPMTVAVDLVGEQFYEWLYEYPKTCHKLLEIITEASLVWENFTRGLTNTPKVNYGIGDDAAQIVSAEMFYEFDVPCFKELYESFPGERHAHMCGNSCHLHKVLVDDLKITHFDGFGSVVDPKFIAQSMGGRVKLTGNVDPVLIQRGTKNEIMKAAMDCLGALAPCGGYILQDGNNIPPGTPLENMRILLEASEKYGFPQKVKRSMDEETI